MSVPLLVWFTVLYHPPGGDPSDVFRCFVAEAICCRVHMKTRSPAPCALSLNAACRLCSHENKEFRCVNLEARSKHTALTCGS
ncbi:hypothetical protein BKA83DRAFT_1559065 [Pisolithus microcarpus]|nr:hypothetical protein BKA83DRAFT_1559065 [Pisolithus microcarpus]